MPLMLTSFKALKLSVSSDVDLSVDRFIKCIGYGNGMSAIDELLSLIKDGKLPYPPRLTKYELAKIVAVRTRQLMDGAPPLINPKELGTMDPVTIAYEELKRGLLPFIVIRKLPNNKRIEYTLKELQNIENEVFS